MKLIIFNLLLVTVCSKPMYRYKLRGMHENDKNIFINTTINDIYDSIFFQVKNKTNNNYTQFDLYCKNNINNITDYKYSYYILFARKKQYKYKECINNYGDLLIYSVPFNIPRYLIITNVIDKLIITFPDYNITNVKYQISYCDIYLILFK